MASYTIGIDFGTLSCRALVLDLDSGKVMGNAEHGYHVYEKRLPDGTPLPERIALGDPADHREALKCCVLDATQNTGISSTEVQGN
ncbi:MAG: ribulokinase, partial [Clostridia bacterium]|nr:ribulokinase [Clostridia bacterium]